MLVFTEYEKLSNIKIEWNTPHVQGFREKKNILLASGDIPDIFYRAKLTPGSYIYRQRLARILTDKIKKGDNNGQD